MKDQTKKKNFKKQNKFTGGTYDKKFDKVRGTMDTKNFGNSKKNTNDCPQDPFFYAKNAQALNNMARFPWAAISGTWQKTDTYKTMIPGIARFEFLFALGNSGWDIKSTGNNIYPDASTVNVNRAVSAAFNYVSVGFSGSVPFQGSDMYVAILCASHIMLKILEGVRAYGLLRYYLQYNVYWTGYMIKSLGFDYENLLAEAANFRTQLNIRIAQFNKSFKVPQGIMAINRWVYMLSNIFLDDPDEEKAQVYHYVPKYYWKWDATGTGAGSAAILQTNLSGISNEFKDVESYFSQLDDLLNAMDDDDVRTIFGAINRVYSPNALFELNELPDDFVTTPIYHDVILDQIHNTDIVEAHYISPIYDDSIRSITDMAITDQYAIYQIPGYNSLCSVLGISAEDVEISSEYPSQLQGFVDVLEHGMVDPAVAIDALNNKVGPTISGNRLYTVEEVEYSSISPRADVVVRVRIFQMGAEGELFDVAYNSNLTSQISNFSYTTSFRYFPLMITSFDSEGVRKVCGELNNYTVISVNQISRLNEACMFTLLDMQPSDKFITK